VFDRIVTGTVEHSGRDACARLERRQALTRQQATDGRQKTRAYWLERYAPGLLSIARLPKALLSPVLLRRPVLLPRLPIILLRCPVLLRRPVLRPTPLEAPGGQRRTRPRASTVGANEARCILRTWGCARDALTKSSS
jgi:hypothetical protein